MFGTRQYRLPNAKRKQPQSEAVEPIEIDEGQVEEKQGDSSFDEVELDQDYDDYDEAEVGNDDNAFDGDEYYFEEEEEPLKERTWEEPIIESDRSDVATFKDLEELVQRNSEVEEPKEEEGVVGSYHARDESEPMKSPPGFVWMYENVSAPGRWTGERLLNLIGLGDASSRFRVKTEEEELAPPEYLALGGGDVESLKRDWLEKKKADLEKKKREAEDIAEAEEYGEEVERQEYNISTLESPEPAEGPRGWMFWNGPRWQHWWYGYESPVSWTGYPAQWFFRAVHLFFPETFDSDELGYEPTKGVIEWKVFPEYGWWMLSHPCLKQIIVNMILITPFSMIPLLRRRLKIIRNRIDTHRTVLPNLLDHLPILIRRLRLRAFKTMRRRYWRWTAFFTFAFAPNCWDLIGHHLDNPTEDFWEKNYIQYFTDGIRTSSQDLDKWLSLQPPKHHGITTKPNIDSLKEHQKQIQQLKESRQAIRDEKLPSHSKSPSHSSLPHPDPDSEWKSLFQTEKNSRKAQINQKFKFNDATRDKLLNSEKDKL